MQFEFVILYLVFVLALVILARISQAFFLQVQTALTIGGIITFFLALAILISGIGYNSTVTTPVYNYSLTPPLLLNQTELVKEQPVKDLSTYVFGLMLIGTAVLLVSIGQTHMEKAY